MGNVNPRRDRQVQVERYVAEPRPVTAEQRAQRLSVAWRRSVKEEHPAHCMPGIDPSGCALAGGIAMIQPIAWRWRTRGSMYLESDSLDVPDDAVLDFFILELQVQLDCVDEVPETFLDLGRNVLRLS